MRRNKNEELEPWELPDRPLNPKEEEKPSSAGSQWVNRPANSQPAPKTAQKAYEVPPPNTRQAGKPVTKQAATREELIGQFRTARRLSNLGAVGLACYALLFLALGALFALPRIREVYFWDEEKFAWLVAAVASGAALVLFVLAFGFLKRNRVGAIAGMVVAILLLFTSGFWGFGGGTACFVAPLLIFSAMGLVGVLSYHRLNAATAGIPNDVTFSAKAPRTLGGTLLFLFFILCALGSVMLLTFSISSYQKEEEAAESWPEEISVVSEAPEPDPGDTVAPEWGVEEAEEPLPEESEPEEKPLEWSLASIPDTGLAIPMPADMDFYEGDYYKELSSSTGITYAYSVEWYTDDPLRADDKDTQLQTVQSLLEGYGSWEDERIVVPVTTGETPDGIVYAQISVECDYGYVYTVRSFFYEDTVGRVSYTQFEPAEWSQEYETAVTNCFNQLCVE